MMLSVNNLEKRLGTFALRNVSFQVERNEYFVLLGVSGVGKTVLLETLAGLLSPDAGQILCDGQDITYERVQKRQMGLVYQDQALFPHLTVRGNIAYGLPRRLRRKAARQRVDELAEAVGVAALRHRYPDSLSGGEAQRVALARTLATGPRCLLLDEPISSLDMAARSEMRALLRRLHRNGHTVVHVTHDYEEAISLASRVGVMEDGTVVQTGTPDEVFHHPTSRFVARFVGIRNFFPGRLETRGSDGAPGRFVCKGLSFYVLCDARPGPGFVILRSEDITLARTRTQTSAQNCFLGTVTDVAPARLGIEVTVDIGVEVAALITARAREELRIECGQKVWISAKATAARFIEA